MLCAGECGKENWGATRTGKKKYWEANGPKGNGPTAGLEKEEELFEVEMVLARYSYNMSARFRTSKRSHWTVGNWTANVGGMPLRKIFRINESPTLQPELGWINLWRYKLGWLLVHSTPWKKALYFVNSVSSNCCLRNCMSAEKS